MCVIVCLFVFVLSWGREPCTVSHYIATQALVLMYHSDSIQTHTGGQGKLGQSMYPAARIKTLTPLAITNHGQITLANAKSHDLGKPIRGEL